MSFAQKLPPRHLTVDEFLDWAAADDSSARWQLRDGEPEMMAPASEAHGSLQSELGRLIGNQLERNDSRCRVVANPGVIPRVRSDRNMLIPDLTITCAPPSGGRFVAEPAVLIEILSPSNESQTRLNVWAYTTIPSVAEILLVSSTAVAAELLRRRPDGSWPEQPEILGATDQLRLQSIGVEVALQAVYRNTTLAARPATPA